MKSSLKIQSGMVVITVVAVAIVYPLCVFFPKMRAISQVRGEIRQQQDYIAQNQRLQPLVATQSQKLATTKQYVEQERARMVPPDQLSHVFSTISQSAQDAGVTTTRFEPHPAILGDTYRKVPVQFGISGPTAAIQRLVAAIESMPRNIWIDGLKLEAASENSETVRCQIDLAIFVDNPEFSR